jgi:hypothetical protein
MTPIERIAARTIEGPTVSESLGACQDSSFAPFYNGRPSVKVKRKGVWKRECCSRVVLEHAFTVEPQ